ncbi:SusC/RagA family TonB-linked outer membrane protein [Maribellus sediminis]|uniref:SusC/RagA family TonB-linked outer membrane protein n=1 Tax=Maribellus sediminis TaxID=2696285 RepID=UPI001431E499|nr:SusC/RagA family TonB-linked outer membrane protein [Maribellus sediminis]
MNQHTKSIHALSKALSVFLFYRKKGVLTLLLFFSFLFTAIAQQSFSLSYENATVKEVLQELRTKGEISFVYEEDLVSKAPKVSFTVKNASLTQVLDSCFTGTNIGYEIKDGTVVIKMKETPRQVQQKKILGRVLDENDLPMPGVTIGFQKEGQASFMVGTTTNIDGNYSITVPDVPGKLFFSFIGYKTQSVDVLGKNLLNVTMEVDVTDIEEVVVTGIFTRKTESYTGASNTVKGDELQQFGNRSVLTSLQNLEPSFNILENNNWGSDPNRLPDIQIRGSSSIPNVNELYDEANANLNTPLVILDGFESNMRVLQDMNENDIESITILKDASATAIYGSRGANGVVVVTSKQPEAGDLRVTWRSDLTLEVPDLTQYDVLNAREKLDLEYKVGLYDSENAGKDLILKRYYNQILSEVNRGVDTYWLSKPLRTGVGHKHNIRLEGGDQRFRYAGSVQYNNIEGAMKGSSRDIMNGSIKLAYIYEKFRFSNNLMIGITKVENSPYGNFSDYVKMNPYWSGYDEDGNVLKQLGYYGDKDYFERWNKLPTNPLYNATLNTFDTNENTSITNNTSVEWNLTHDLKLRGSLGITKQNSSSDVFKPADHTDFANYSEADAFRKGSYAYGTGASLRYDGSLNLSYNSVINNKHYIFGGADYNVRASNTTNYGFKAEGFSSQRIDFLGTALQYAEGGSPTGSESVSRSIGLTANANYMYDAKYIIDASIRYDGSSQFGSDKRFATFWAIGLGWNMHDEAFMEGSFIDRLKLRASIGTNGSQNFNSYQALSTYRYYTDDRYYNWTGAYLASLGNTDLKWQQKLNHNVGFESAFLDSRLLFQLDMYLDKTNDLISSVDLPASNGFNSYVANIGKVENRGFELLLNTYIIKNYQEGLTWNISVSSIHNKNTILEISEALKEAQEDLESAATTNPNKLFREGYSINTIWVVRSLGIDPSTGKEIYVRKNGEKTFIWSAADLIDGGNSEPKYRGNINSTLRYKKLTVNMSFGYRLGGQSYNNTLIDKVENANFRYNVDSRVYDDRWQEPGDEAAFKGLMVNTTTFKSTRFVQNENTLTFNNLNLRYDFSSSEFLKSKGIQNFMLTANTSNLFYISTVKQERGINYPFARNFSLGLSVIF